MSGTFYLHSHKYGEKLTLTAQLSDRFDDTLHIIVKNPQGQEVYDICVFTNDPEHAEKVRNAINNAETAPAQLADA